MIKRLTKRHERYARYAIIIDIRYFDALPPPAALLMFVRAADARPQRCCYARIACCRQAYAAKGCLIFDARETPYALMRRQLPRRLYARFTAGNILRAPCARYTMPCHAIDTPRCCRLVA